MSKLEKKSFNDLYEEQKKKPTSAQVFITKIAKITHRSENTVRMWLSGKQYPDELTRVTIAKDLGIPVETLFPQEQK